MTNAKNKKVIRMEWSYKTTVGEICTRQVVAGGREAFPLFFRELLDCKTIRCYGIQHLTQREVLDQMSRLVGAYGEKQIEFKSPFDVQRGAKIITVKASKKKPIRCIERIYAQI